MIGMLGIEITNCLAGTGCMAVMECWTVDTQDFELRVCKIVVCPQDVYLRHVHRDINGDSERGELALLTSAPPRDKNPTIFGTELQFEIADIAFTCTVA